MTPSSNPTRSPRIRRRFCDDAYNASENTVLTYLREKDPDYDVFSFEDLAARVGLAADVVEKTTKALVKRHLVSIAPLSDDGLKSPTVIKARPVEKLEY